MRQDPSCSFNAALISTTPFTVRNLSLPAEIFLEDFQSCLAETEASVRGTIVIAHAWRWFSLLLNASRSITLSMTMPQDASKSLSCSCNMAFN